MNSTLHHSFFLTSKKGKWYNYSAQRVALCVSPVDGLTFYYYKEVYPWNLKSGKLLCIRT